MKEENTTVLEHQNFQGEYQLLKLAAPQVGPQVNPGQFLHLQIPRLGDRVLRRPFSIYQADASSVTVLYKTVGRGTEAMKALKEGDAVSIIGPLGNGFPTTKEGNMPVLVAGGYGNAALYLHAKKATQPGIAFFGGRTAIDILCADAFEKLGWDVRVTTEDGSLGTKGLITAELDPWLEAQGTNAPLELFACGPNGLLKVVGERAIARDLTAWLSMDKNMACGVGACLTCVIKRRITEGSWEWARCCKDGPVFESREIIWEE